MKFFYYVVYEITLFLHENNEEPLIFKGDGEFELHTPLKSIDEINNLKDSIKTEILPILLEENSIFEPEINRMDIILDNFIFLRSETYYKRGLE